MPTGTLYGLGKTILWQFNFQEVVVYFDREILTGEADLMTLLTLHHRGFVSALGFPWRMIVLNLSGNPCQNIMTEQKTNK